MHGLSLTMTEYEKVRKVAIPFVVKPNQVDAEVEVVVTAAPAARLISRRRQGRQAGRTALDHAEPPRRRCSQRASGNTRDM
jgi:hypothetical protein